MIKIQENKYYNWKCKENLTKKDGCGFGSWTDEQDNFSFAVHPDGFLVFLNFQEIKKCDEYSEIDPYGVEQKFDCDFQKRRFDSTIKLLKLAISNKKNVKILDVGCGEGFITKEIQNNFPDAQISGLDYSISAIKSAVNKFTGIDFIVASALDNLPYSSGYFDVVVCNNLWEHVPEPLTLLSQINNITRTGGYLILSTPSRYRIENLYKVLTGESVNFMSDYHVSEYSIGQVIEQLRYKKFDVIKTFSTKIKHEIKSKRGFFVYKILYPLLKAYLRLIKSHHSLESTVFFMAKKRIDKSYILDNRFEWKGLTTKKNKILVIRSGTKRLSDIIMRDIAEHCDNPEIFYLCHKRNFAEVSEYHNIKEIFVYNKSATLQPGKMSCIVDKLNLIDFDYVIFILNNPFATDCENIIELVNSIDRGTKVAYTFLGQSSQRFLWNH